MFHCHNAVHEDKGMMGIFNVTKLADLGYKDLETGLEDPMDSRFRAKPYTTTNLDEIKSKTLPFFASLNAYPDPDKLAEVEDRYWSTRTPPSADLTGPPAKGGGMGGMMGGGMGTQLPTKGNVVTEDPPTSTTSPSMVGTGMGGVNGTGAMGSGTMGGAGLTSAGIAGAGGLSGASTPGGPTGCSSHNSHHGGCRRR